MKRIFGGIAVSLAVIAVAIGAFTVSARNGWLNASEASLRGKYALPASRFMEIDGQSIHYTDEGKGDPIVLVHGSFGSLLMWNDWVKALAPRYRVIRFDRPPEGLSGADPQGRPALDREIEIIDKLTARLGVPRFFLAATSSGGESAAAYAATHPEKIRGLILSNIAAGPLAHHPTDYPLGFRITLALDPWFGGWHSTALWRGVLRSNFADPSKVRDEVVAQWTDLNNRAQGMRRSTRPAGYIPFARTPADLARITAPSLVLWSDRDPEVPLDPVGRRTLALLGAKDKHLQVVANCGHMMPIECGPASAQDARAFLDRIDSAK